VYRRRLLELGMRGIVEGLALATVHEGPLWVNCGCCIQRSAIVEKESYIALI
jgi:hypothetical protein